MQIVVGDDPNPLPPPPHSTKRRRTRAQDRAYRVATERATTAPPA
ncbi:hypothetical protein [Mycobacterium ostraviense]|nr:hypothetical protein [Mycobacterium ostraviense]